MQPVGGGTGTRTAVHNRLCLPLWGWPGALASHSFTLGRTPIPTAVLIPLGLAFAFAPLVERALSKSMSRADVYTVAASLFSGAAFLGLVFPAVYTFYQRALVSNTTHPGSFYPKVVPKSHDRLEAPRCHLPPLLFLQDELMQGGQLDWDGLQSSPNLSGPAWRCRIGHVLMLALFGIGAFLQAGGELGPAKVERGGLLPGPSTGWKEN